MKTLSMTKWSGNLYRPYRSRLNSEPTGSTLITVTKSINTRSLRDWAEVTNRGGDQWSVGVE